MPPRMLNDENGLTAEQGDAVDVDICICSYRRPEIVLTLAAIANRESLDGVRVRIIVADNTQEAACRQIVQQAADTLGMDLHYVHAPANNISRARNACLDAASGQWIAFLDDDEIPERNWLRALLDEAADGRWDAVLGPVIAVYPPAAPAWMKRSDLHSTRPVKVRGAIQAGYTGNVLIRRALCEQASLRFRLELGNTGGEDEDFFYRFRDAGGRIGYAPNAISFESVPVARTRIAWLMRRNFRAGQTYGRRLQSTGRLTKELPLAAAKTVFCAAGSLGCAWNMERGARFLTRAALHCGVAARLAGFREIRNY